MTDYSDPWNITNDDQFYYAFRPWNDSVRVRRDFGPDSIHNLAYAFAHDAAQNTSFLAGSVPFKQTAFEAQEQREMLIYRFNDHGMDSIRLYGQRNHVPLWLHPDANGDLFVFSTYTDSWTTDSTFYMLTKIPGFAISLIEEGKTQASIELYPNPATDYIRVDRLREEVWQLEFYTQAGRLVKSISVKEEFVNIRDLKNGLYIVVATNAEGERSQVLIQKK